MSPAAGLPQVWALCAIGALALLLVVGFLIGIVRGISRVLREVTRCR